MIKLLKLILLIPEEIKAIALNFVLCYYININDNLTIEVLILNLHVL